VPGLIVDADERAFDKGSDIRDHSAREAVEQRRQQNGKRFFVSFAVEGATQFVISGRATFPAGPIAAGV
jgi:hypothetical protein